MITAHTYYTPHEGRIRGTHRDDMAMRATLVARWGDQIAASPFDGVSIATFSDGTTRTYVTRHPRCDAG